MDERYDSQKVPRSNEPKKLSDSSLFRFLIFILLPLIGIILCGINGTNYYAGLINLFGINIILVAA